ncbi:MAG TPA: hypothetical protein VIH90_05680 [Candidatus Saccharimonadales bacterium]
MSERSRTIERVVGVALIGAASIAGYFTGEAHDSAPKPVPAAVAKPHSESKPRTDTTKKDGHKTTTTTAPVLTQQSLEAPLIPTGGDYNNAAQAAYDADIGDSTDAIQLLSTLTDPAILAQAEKAVQIGYAAEAAYDAQGSDSTDANSLLSLVTLPSVAPKARKAVAYGTAERAAYDAAYNQDYTTAQSLETQISAFPYLVGQVQSTIQEEKSGNSANASNTWDSLYNTADDQWNSLYTEGQSEWDNLYSHSDSYVQYYDSLPK